MMRPASLLLWAAPLFLRGRVPPTPAAPLPPEPTVGLELRTSSDGAPWKLVVVNASEVALHLAADARLLELDVVPASPEDGEKKTKTKSKKPREVRCRLPDDLRPNRADASRVILVERGARYETTFDPFLYCFGAAQSKVLGPGAVVTAKLGFTQRRPLKKTEAPSGPFVVEPAAETDRFSAIGELTAIPVTLSEAARSPLLISPSLASPSEDAASTHKRDTDAGTADDVGDNSSADEDKGPLSVSAPAFVEASGPRDVAFHVSVKNRSKRPLMVHLRRDDLGFDIDGPGARVHCGSSVTSRASARDFFTTLRPGETRALDVWLGEVCPDASFDRPGLYAIRPSVLLADAGEAYGLHAFTGFAAAATPSLLRVHTGPRPFFTTPPKATSAERSELRSGPHGWALLEESQKPFARVVGSKDAAQPIAQHGQRLL